MNARAVSVSTACFARCLGSSLVVFVDFLDDPLEVVSTCLCVFGRELPRLHLDGNGLGPWQFVLISICRAVP